MSDVQRPMSLGEQVRTVAGNARLAVGATIGVLLVVVPAVILVALVATDHAGDIGGLVVLVGLIAMGLYVIASTLGQAEHADKPATILVPHPSGLYGPTEVPAPPPPGRPARPWVAVVTVLAVLVIGPFLIAIPMSITDDYLYGHRTAGRIVVTVISSIAILGVGWAVRRATARRP